MRNNPFRMALEKVIKRSQVDGNLHFLDEATNSVQFDNQFTHLRISSNFSALVIYMETLNEKKENG